MQIYVMSKQTSLSGVESAIFAHEVGCLVPVAGHHTGILLTCPVFFKAENKMEGHHD